MEKGVSSVVKNVQGGQPMNQKNLPNSRSTLKDIQNQFEIWRRTREKRAPIPAPLWGAAVNLSKDYTILQISKALRLNYTDLKDRVLSQPDEEIVKVERNLPFIELDFEQIKSPSHCVIEMEKSNGAKLKMYFSGEGNLDFLELGKSFWRNGS
jgi:hypothetical protein